MCRLALLLATVSSFSFAQNGTVAPNSHDAELRLAATQFASEVRVKCMDDKEKTNPAPIIKMLEQSHPNTTIKMNGALKYDKPTGNCVGQFTVTHVKSGSARNFQIPPAIEDTKPH